MNRSEFPRYSIFFTRIIPSALLLLYATSTSIIFILPANAAPAKSTQLCLNSANGSVVGRAKCKKDETVFNAESIAKIAKGAIAATPVTGIPGPIGPQGIPGVAGPQGPQGPKGDTGAAGNISPDKCTVRSASYEGLNYVYGDAKCNAGEFLLTHGMQAVNSFKIHISAINLLVGDSTQVANGVGYETETEEGHPNQKYTIQIDIICCKP